MADKIKQTIKDAEYVAMSATGNAVIVIKNYYYNEQSSSPIKPSEIVIEEKGECPYRGLRHFDHNHNKFFFGRDVFIEKLLKAIETHNFIPVIGTSGSGKTSVVLAGLIPRLQQKGYWQFTHFRPGDNPFRALAFALVPLYEQELDATKQIKQAKELERDLFDGTLSLSDVFAKIQQVHPSHQVLLIADQFEELYTQRLDTSALLLAKKDNTPIDATDVAALTDLVRQRFLDCLVASFQTPITGTVPSTVLVATLRADFLGNALSYRPFADILQDADIKLGAMNRSELSEIIEKPAELVGVKFEDGLINRILNDVENEPGNLPLLEFALTELWTKQIGKKMTHTTYDAIGQVKGAITTYANEIYNKLASDDKERAQRIFIQLVSIGDNTTDARRRASRHELENDWNLVNRLADSRLIITGRNDIGQETVEVVHEALIRNWDQLREWMIANRGFREWQEQLRTNLRQWETSKEDDGALLRGKPLLDAETWLRGKRGVEISLKERAFIQKSLNVARRRKFIIYGTALSTILIIFAIMYYFTQTALADQFFAEAEKDLSKKDYARAEIMAAKSLTIHNADKTRDLLLKAQSGGISLVSNSSQKMPSATLSQFSRDGQLIASILNDDHGKPITIAIISSSDSKEKWRINLSSSESMPDSMTFSESDTQPRLLAVARSNHSVDVWSLSDGKSALLLNELSTTEHHCKHTKRIPSMAFHPSKPWIVTSSEDQRLCLWDYSRQPAQLVWEKEDAHATAIHGIAFNMDGSLLASGGGDYLAKIWKTADMSLGKNVYPIKIMSGHTDSVFAVAFSPDGHRLASGGYDRVIRVWNLDLKGEDNQPITVGTLAGHEGTVMDIAFSNDSKLLISSGKDNAARIWDVSAGRVLATLTPENGIIRSVAWRNFEDNIYLGGEMGWSIWSPRGRKVAARLWNGGATIGTIAFDPAGHFLTAAGDDGKVRVWDNEYSVYPLKSNFALGGVNALAISADSQWLAAAGEGKIIHIWKHGNDWKSWNEITPTASDTLKHDGAIWGLCFDPKGRWLFSSNTDENRRIKRWKVSDWSFMDQSEPVMKDTAYSLACDIGGSRIISGDSNGVIKVWETEHLTMKSEIRNVKQGEANVWSVTMSTNPPYIFSGNSDGHVYRWLPNDPAWTGGLKEKIGTSDKDATINPTINSVSFNQKYGWVAAGGDGRSIEIYDINLKHLQSLAGQDATIWYVAFDQQGSRLAFGGADRILYIFNFDEIQKLKSASPKNLYQEAQRMTGFSVDKSEIIVNKLSE
jgi:WD40 repeat protein